MPEYCYLEDDLHNCKLCEWCCGVDRLAGEVGICGITIPKVASSQLHPAPPSSFDAFLFGCNFKCIFCQNWSISMYNESQFQRIKSIEAYINPQTWAELGITCLNTPEAKYIKADRLFFTGGEPTCSLPWIESVVEYARDLIPELKVNFDTNGYLSKKSLDRILDFTSSITFDLKAFNPELFKALTGANVEPVIRNLKYILRNLPDKIWEVRVMVIPGVHEDDVENMCKFFADFFPKIKLNFLAFRPNFIMEDYIGATNELMQHCLKMASDHGLENASWSGRTGINGKLPNQVRQVIKCLDIPKNIALPLGFAQVNNCSKIPRYCGSCEKKNDCPIKRYRPIKIS